MKLSELFKDKEKNKFKQICFSLIQAGLHSKDIVLEFYKNGFETEIKADNSPVTQADLASNKYICDFLTKEYPNFAILSEENKDNLSRLKFKDLFIIDPIDGTSDFINHDDEFSINLAYALDKKVVVGVIVVPAKNLLYFSFNDNNSYKYYIDQDKIENIHVSARENDLIVLTSRMHSSGLDLLEPIKNKIKQVVPCGSSYKGCQIAEGKADIYYTTSKNTKEWDVAPIDVIVKNAGGYFLNLDGYIDFEYNREDPYNQKGFYVCNIKENIIK